MSELTLTIDPISPGVATIDGSDGLRRLVLGMRCRRIVACVNACAEMSTKYLEQCGPMKRNEAGESVATLIQQRNDLLALLEDVESGTYDANPIAYSNWLGRVRAIIKRTATNPGEQANHLAHVMDSHATCDNWSPAIAEKQS